jgi:hypothetical protein
MNKLERDALEADLAAVQALLRQHAMYFSNLFSHQRATSLWKGMIEVSLTSDDALARMSL